MTNPTPLSPAAQAVLIAAEKQTDLDFRYAPQIAAAALRAAAEKIEDLYCESNVDDSDGVVFALRQLMLLSNELEGAND